MANVTEYLAGRFLNDEKEVVGIGGFKALVRISEKVSMTASSPDTFLEDGSHVNDHIINNPIILSIEGEVSDVFLETKVLNELQRKIESQAGNIAQYLPGRTQAQLSRVSGVVNSVFQGIEKANAIIASGQQAAEFLGLTDTAAQQRSNQERFLDEIDSIYKSKKLINIDMPFRTYKNMVLTSIEISYDNEINSTGFSIQAKEFRTAETIFVEVAPAPAAGMNGALNSETDKGPQAGAEPEQSFLSYTFGKIF